MCKFNCHHFYYTEPIEQLVVLGAIFVVVESRMHCLICFGCFLPELQGLLSVLLF